MTHAPGPWTSAQSKNGYVIQAEWTAISELKKFNNTPEQLAGNAALISAAPDLLAACQAVYSEVLGSREASVSGATFNMIEAAIAKATTT